MKTAAFIIVFGFLWIGFVSAQTRTPGADRRENIQKERIRDGIQKGELSRKETRKLVREQRHIERAEKRAGVDGMVSKRERIRLDRKQDRASRHIGRAKNNTVDRY